MWSYYGTSSYSNSDNEDAPGRTSTFFLQRVNRHEPLRWFEVGWVAGKPQGPMTQAASIHGMVQNLHILFYSICLSYGDVIPLVTEGKPKTTLQHSTVTYYVRYYILLSHHALEISWRYKKVYYKEADEIHLDQKLLMHPWVPFNCTFCVYVWRMWAIGVCHTQAAGIYIEGFQWCTGVLLWHGTPPLFQIY